MPAARLNVESQGTKQSSLPSEARTVVFTGGPRLVWNRGLLWFSSVLAGPTLASDILVYNNNTQHGLGLAAAMNIDAAGTVTSDSGTFDNLLGSQAWDWDCYPGLQSAFGVTTIAKVFLSTPETLQDSGTSSAFSGVTMPNSDWDDHWFDDGDTFNPGSGTGLAHIGNPAEPVVVLGNGGNTICSHVLDEAGWNTSDGVEVVFTP